MAMHVIVKVHYDFRIKRCSVRLSLQLFVGGLLSYLRYLCLFAYCGVTLLSVSLKCPFLIAPSVFSDVYFYINGSFCQVFRVINVNNFFSIAAVLSPYLLHFDMYFVQNSLPLFHQFLIVVLRLYICTWCIVRKSTKVSLTHLYFLVLYISNILINFLTRQGHAFRWNGSSHVTRSYI
jgi:hypothetical protein